MAFTQPPPIPSLIQIEQGNIEVLNPLWVKWFSDLAKSLQATTSTTVDVGGASGTFTTTAGDVLVFANGILTSFTPGPPLPP